MIGGAVIGVLGPVIVADGKLESYYVLIFGSMALTLVLSISGALSVKERVEFGENNEEKYSLKEMLQFLRYKPIWAAFAATLIVGTGSSIAGGAGAYFYTYVLGDMKLMSGVSIIGLIASLVGIVMGPYLANRFGKKKVYLTAVIISTALNLLRLLDVTSMILIYISALIGGVAGGWMVPVSTSIQADNTTYVQYKTGKRAEAAIASLTSFVSKVAQGLGGAIPGYVIAAYGFVTGASVQPESINTGIILCALILPLIFGILGSLIFGTQYTLDQKAVIEMDAKINRNN